MARTAAGAALTQQHRSDQLGVRAAMLSGLTQLWGVVNPLDLSGTIDRFSTTSAVLIRTHHRDSALLGRTYFRDFRIVEGMGSLDGAADPVDAAPFEVLAGLLRGAALSGIVNSRRRGFSPEAAARQGQVKASGQATTLTLNGGRDTIRDGIGNDPEALGWIRITSGSPCSWCAMVASRAETNLFSTEKTADFKPHDHCSCEPEPIYPNSGIPELNRRFREQWNETGTLNAFRRAREGRA